MKYYSSQKRIDSFNVDEWRQQPISRLNSSLLEPESFASASFFYMGTADVMCFWCALCVVNDWEALHDPITEQVRFTPRCFFWKLRRHRVKSLYIKSQRLHAGSSALPNFKPANYSFFRDVHEITGS